MALPQMNSTPNFINVKLPSGKSIGCRGWKVKDEKDLLFILDAEENPDATKAGHLINFLRNCVDKPAVFDTLSDTDLKKVAVEVRKLSKGDTIAYTYTCPHVIGEGVSATPCRNKINDEIKLSVAEKVKAFDGSPVPINDKLIISFKDLPNKKALELWDKYQSSLAKYTYYYMINSIEAVVYDNQPYTEFTEEEMIDFLDPLDSNDMEKISNEFEKRGSSLDLERKIKCRKCGQEIDVNFGDLLSFLTF